MKRTMFIHTGFFFILCFCIGYIQFGKVVLTNAEGIAVSLMGSMIMGLGVAAAIDISGGHGGPG